VRPQHYSEVAEIVPAFDTVIFHLVPFGLRKINR
jgi:hypothetical protein